MHKRRVLLEPVGHQITVCTPFAHVHRCVVSVPQESVNIHRYIRHHFTDITLLDVLALRNRLEHVYNIYLQNPRR